MDGGGEMLHERKGFLLFLNHCFQDHYHHHHHACASITLNVNECFFLACVSGILRLQKGDPGHKLY